MTTQYEIHRRTRLINDWLGRNALKCRPVTADDTWKKIHEWWPRMDMADAERIFQQSMKANHTGIFFGRIMMPMRKN